MRRRPDGSIQSGNTPTPANLQYVTDTKMYRAIVTKVNFVDSQNFTQDAANPRVLYDVVVLGGSASGQVITSCRLSTDLASNNNFHERGLKATTKALNETPIQDQDGDVVFVTFIQGDQNYPVITGLDNGANTQNDLGATPEDGVREIRQFNGIRQETNKVGEYTFSRQGGVVEEEVFKGDTGDPKYKLELLDVETLKETFKSGLIREVDGEADVITKTFDGGLILSEDGKADKYTRTFNGGLTITEDGAGDKVTISTSGGGVIVVDGPGSKITLTHGSTVINLDALTGKIALVGDFVDIGNSVSDFAVLFTELLGQFNSHFHQAPQAPSGTLPTTPPTAPMLPSVGSTTIQIQP